MARVAARESADAILHLGDHLNDARALAERTGAPVYGVAGNTDTAAADAYERIVTLGGKRFLLMHGHQFELETEFWQGLARLLRHGVGQNADFILFGHTHEPFVHRCERVWLMNPGRAGRSRDVHASYGLIHLRADGVRCEIAEAVPAP